MTNKHKASGSGSSLDRLKSRAQAVQVTSEREVLIPLSKLRFDPDQPRKAFHHLDGRIEQDDEVALQELAKSIEQNELIESITVREAGDGTYIVVVGERRTRAHILLGKPNIRSVVRNDLNNPALRLLYQLTENVARQDLSDEEMAESIQKLLAGDKGAGVPPLNQVQIAEKLGKSEGWVTRYKAFGDNELKRVWVTPGIADSVEKVYRLSILPAPVQAEILRRTSLPESDPEYLAKPLNRNVIDDLAREAKAAKRQVAATPPVSALPAATPGKDKGGAAQPSTEPVWPFPTGAGKNSDSKEHESASAAGKQVAAGGGAAAINTKGYTLPDASREKILGSTPSEETDKKNRNPDELTAPVKCQVTARNVGALIEHLQQRMEGTDDFDAALAIRCEVNIPGDLAKSIVNLLAGYIVPDQEIPAVMQAHLSALEIAAIQ